MPLVKLIVPIDYGSNASTSGLSRASVAALEAASEYLNEHQGEDYTLACCNADFPHLDMQVEDSARWKNEILDGALERPIHRIMVPATNSITEARNIRDALEEAGIKPYKIILFCDRWHAMRLRMVWPHFLPDSEIAFKTGRYVRGSDYAQVLLRRPLTWGGANIAGLLAMKLFGIERLAAIKQP